MPTEQIEQITISLAEYNDLIKYKQAIEEKVEYVRNSENMVGPKIFHYYSAPKSDASSTEKIDWFDSYFDASVKMMLDLHSVKKKLFTMSSKKTDKKQGSKKQVKDKSKSIDTINDENDTNNIALRILYDEYENIKEKIKDLKEVLDNFNQENKESKEITDEREQLMFKINQLQERQKSIEDEIYLVRTSNNKDLTDKKENLESNDINDNSSKHEASETKDVDYDQIRIIIEEIFSLSFYDYDNQFSILLPDIMKEIEKIYIYEKECAKKSEENKKEFAYLNKISEKFFTKVTEINSVKPNVDDIDVYKYFYNSKKIYQTSKNRKISSHVYKWDIHQKIDCDIKTLCTDDNIQFEINSASTFNLSSFDKNNRLISNLNTHRILNNYPDEDDIKTKINEKYHYPKELLDIMVVVRGKYSNEDVLVISPTEFAGMIKFIFGSAPSFVGKHVSLYSLTLMISEILSLFTTKSKLSSFYKMQHGDCVENRQQFILNFNGFGRCFKGLEELQRKILLTHSKSLLVDETFIKCLEFTNALNVVFSLASGKHDKLRGVSYVAANTRSTEEFLNILLKDELSLIENIESLITDCCPTYFSPELKKTLINIRNAVCHSHARRRILEDLSKIKLDKIFLQLSKLSLNDFVLTLQKEIKDGKIKFGHIGSRLFFALFMLEILFRLEKDFPYQDKNVMQERRQRFSKPIINIYFRILEDLALSFKGVTHNYDGCNDIWQGSGINIGEYSSLYILNHKDKFYEFINNGDTEITNNLSEFLLREIARYRDCMEFFATIDGITSFMVLDSLAVTSTLNNLNNFFYLLWVAVNSKVRLELYRLGTIKNNPDQGGKQICLLPHKEIKLNQDGTKEKKSMYDPENKIIYDMISFEGLDTWSCVELLRSEKLKIKNEYID